VLARLGDEKVDKLGRQQLQELADDLDRKGLDPSTIRNSLMPVRALYRRLIQRGQLATNPTVSLALPAVRGERDRIVTPEEAARPTSPPRGRETPMGDRPLCRASSWRVDGAAFRGSRLREGPDPGRAFLRSALARVRRAEVTLRPENRPDGEGSSSVPGQVKLSSSGRTGLIFSVDGE